MRYGVLGPMLCCIGDTDIAPAAPKLRQLLALLLMNANRPVSPEYCIEELWGQAPPSSAAATLQTYIMQLRKRIDAVDTHRAPGTTQRLQTRQRHYLLHIQSGEFDVEEFEDKARRARATLAADTRHAEDQEVSIQLRDALATWRGPVFADIPTGPVLSMWVTSLRETRLAVLEQRIEVDLRLGRHHELIGELSGIVQRSPLTETLIGHLMLALYRSGRQVHALQAYERLRRALADGSGLVPTPSLQELRRKILTNAAELDPPNAQPSSRFAADTLTGRLRSASNACLHREAI